MQPPILSVSMLNRLARERLESAFPLCWVAGEISNLTQAASGHVYFSLKDEGAQVRCVMFRNRAQLLGWRLENGQHVEARVLVSLYEARGDFQLNVETARQAAPLTRAGLQGTPLATSVEGLLLSGSDHVTALVSLSGLQDPVAVARVAAENGAQLLDLKEASESLVAAYRGRVLAALGVAAILLVITVWVSLRQPRRVIRVLLPMALTTLLILAILRGLGVELNLFHLVALILAAGLGLDYALFFDHAGDDRDDQLRTLHALIVCSLMTLLVFTLLGLSSIPVLRAIGSTVAIGVLGNFVLALLVSRQPVTEQPDAVA